MTTSGARIAPSNLSGERRTPVLTVVLLSVLLIAALVGIDLLVLSRDNTAHALAPHYYMALGDSLSFGYQPNFDFTSGFADDVFNDLRQANVTGVVNYACAGETTSTMIHGGCIGRIAHHGSYIGPQLQAAVDFLKDSRNHGRVSPITLEIGSNDVIADFNQATCSASSTVTADLARMDSDLTQVILPELLGALGAGTSATNGDLHMLNYYNPFARECPGSAPFAHLLNNHLQADAAQFRISVVDVYSAFGGDTGTASHICDYTWICDSRFHDIHPTNQGYTIIAKAVELTLGLPGTAPLPGALPASGAVLLAPIAAFWRRARYGGDSLENARRDF